MKILKIYCVLCALLVLNMSLDAQENKKEEHLDSIIISSSRIQLPFKENSRTITVISSTEIMESPATTITELLQQVAGVDIRRRGVNGMQADLYIRGGGFNTHALCLRCGTCVFDTSSTSRCPSSKGDHLRGRCINSGEVTGATGLVLFGFDTCISRWCDGTRGIHGARGVSATHTTPL